MAEAPKELVSCSSVEVVSEGGTIDGSADLCLHPVEVRCGVVLVAACAAELGVLSGVAQRFRYPPRFERFRGVRRCRANLLPCCRGAERNHGSFRQLIANGVVHMFGGSEQLIGRP